MKGIEEVGTLEIELKELQDVGQKQEVQRFKKCRGRGRR